MQQGKRAAPHMLPLKRPHFHFGQKRSLERCSVFSMQSPKNSVLNHTNAPIKVPVVPNVQLSSIKVQLFSQKNRHQEHRGGLVMPLPASTPGDDSPSPTVLQVNRLAINLLWWRACAVSPWVERTVATGYHGAIGVVPISETDRGWCHYFVIPKKGGRTLSYSQSSAKQIPTNLQIQDVNTQTAAECYKSRRLVHND